MSDYGSVGDPASELHRLLTTGAVGGALQQYLTATLGALSSGVGALVEAPSQCGWCRCVCVHVGALLLIIGP